MGLRTQRVENSCSRLYISTLYTESEGKVIPGYTNTPQIKRQAWKSFICNCSNNVWTIRYCHPPFTIFRSSLKLRSDVPYIRPVPGCNWLNVNQALAFQNKHTYFTQYHNMLDIIYSSTKTKPSVQITQFISLGKEMCSFWKTFVPKLSVGKQILYKNSNLGMLGRVHC
jgi:hypothetical protein